MIKTSSSPAEERENVLCNSQTRCIRSDWFSQSTNPRSSFALRLVCSRFHSHEKRCVNATKTKELISCVCNPHFRFPRLGFFRDWNSTIGVSGVCSPLLSYFRSVPCERRWTPSGQYQRMETDENSNRTNLSSQPTNRNPDALPYEGNYQVDVSSTGFELESITSSYTGLARIYRLVHIAEHCPSLRREVLLVLLKYVQETHFVSLYNKVRSVDHSLFYRAVRYVCRSSRNWKKTTFLFPLISMLHGRRRRSENMFKSSKSSTPTWKTSARTRSKIPFVAVMKISVIIISMLGTSSTPFVVMSVPETIVSRRDTLWTCVWTWSKLRSSCPTGRMFSRTSPKQNKRWKVSNRRANPRRPRQSIHKRRTRWSPRMLC